MDEFEWFWIKLPWKQSREKVWREKEKGKKRRKKNQFNTPKTQSRSNTTAPTAPTY